MIVSFAVGVFCLLSIVLFDPSVTSIVAVSAGFFFVLSGVLAGFLIRFWRLSQKEPESGMVKLPLPLQVTMVNSMLEGEFEGFCSTEEDMTFGSEDLAEAKSVALRSRNLYEIASQRFEELFNGVPVACFTCDESGTIFEWNRSAEELWGVPAFDVLQKPLHPIICIHESEVLVNDLLSRVFNGEAIEQIEIQTCSSAGEMIWALAYLFPLRTQNGDINGAVWSFVDNTDRKKQSDLIRESETRFRTCIEWMQNGVIVMEQDGLVTVCNDRAAEILGWPIEAIRSPQFRFGNLQPFRQNGEEVTEVNCPVTLSLCDGKTCRDERLGLKKQDGSTVWVSINSSPIIGTDGNSGIVISFADITLALEQEIINDNQLVVISEYGLLMQQQAEELAIANERLSTIATTDGLTGLKNHRSFQEFLESQFQQSKRYKTPLSLIILDVDHFKQFNDTFGHPAGDEVLIEVGKLLESCARNSDMVARYGGEEFVMVLPNTNRAGAVVSAERIRKAVESGNWTKRQITISLGCSTLIASMEERSDLIKAADEAMYVAKRDGRNRAVHSSAKKKAA
jgi:diguanylate cyclase (GGDEF)-like protein/PAS domain S-box-containing protein